MQKIETVYARLDLKSYNDTLTLNELQSEINERIYEVLKDEFYLKKLTDQLAVVHPEIFADWLKYREHPSLENRPSDELSGVGVFEVLGQKVDLVDIRFY